MILLEKYLSVKRSTIPFAEKGLFTFRDIKRGIFIVEYKGLVRTWKEIQEGKGCNGYMYYVNKNHVIDAKSTKQYLGRYANDANGIGKLKGATNNAAFSISNNKVFIKAIKSIKAGEEIFVSYGKEYWDVLRYNNLLSKTSSKKV